MELPKELKEKARGRQKFKHGERVIYEWYDYIVSNTF
jgi:hypothetical protein